MKLGEKQECFARSLALLFLYIYSHGYAIRPKHLFRCQDCKVGSKNSVHKISLAIDIVITKNGDILTGKHKIFKMAHDYWETIGGAPRIENDLGHFSIEHNGYY